MNARLRALFTVSDFAREAHARLPPGPLGYFRSGADAQRTLADNRRAFRRWSLLPRVLVDVTHVRLETTVLGTKTRSPILIAPTAYHRMAHEDGENGTARAAAASGTIYVVSTLATTSLEEVARASAKGPRWFQLYVHKDRGLTRGLVERAEAHGYRAIVLTVDTPLLGRRLADARAGFSLPKELGMPNLLAPGEKVPKSYGESSLQAYVASRHDPSLTWKDIAWLRKTTKLPIALKGILRADDAARAAKEGVDGVVVSNHGGRQLDSVPATLDALPRVRDAVERARGEASCEVMLDGGVRWGTDVLKALALGARAVLVGRPVLWGLAVGGEAGVARVLEILNEELARAMALAGAPSLDVVTSDLVETRAHRSAP